MTQVTVIQPQQAHLVFSKPLHMTPLHLTKDVLFKKVGGHFLIHWKGTTVGTSPHLFTGGAPQWAFYCLYSTKKAT